MKTLILCLLTCVGAINAIHAQGSMVFDQESSTDEAYPVSGLPIQFYGSVGQSFTPSLSTVGFVRLKLKDINPGNALGATLVVNLRANAINGTILGTTVPVVMNDGFVGSANFIFGGAVAVTPSTTYFFETVVQSGDSWGITALGDSYPGGVFHGGLQPFSGNDLWFREGVVVPEPATSALLVGGVLAIWLARNRRG